jgi:hypothetical protein
MVVVRITGLYVTSQKYIFYILHFFRFGLYQVPGVPQRDRVGPLPLQGGKLCIRLLHHDTQELNIRIASKFPRSLTCTKTLATSRQTATLRRAWKRGIFTDKSRAIFDYIPLPIPESELLFCTQFCSNEKLLLDHPRDNYCTNFRPEIKSLFYFSQMLYS